MNWLKKRWWVLVIGVIAAVVIGFVAWGLIIPAPMPEALEALQTGSEVMVTTEPWLVFQPAGSTATAGFIFYPGGRVDPRSYAPMAYEIASQGYLVVIVPMPLNLAVLGSGRATQVIEAYPEIEKWVIGGHSLGGSMAAAYADKHDDQIDGLALMASYPAGSNSLVENALSVTSIFATQDGLATGDKISASRELLPAGTTWVQVDGGNHAQFGWYGEQSGDLSASISREEQQAQVIQATLELLASVEQNP